MVEGGRGGGGPEYIPSHNLDNVAEHVAKLEGHSNFRGEPRPSQPDPVGELSGQQTVEKVRREAVEVPEWLIRPNESESIVKEKGWDSFTELLLDASGYLPKPYNPSIPPDDIEALTQDEWLSLGTTANNWEEETVNTLQDEGFGNLVPPFKQQMQKYRKSVKATVRLWRKQGLL